MKSFHQRRIEKGDIRGKFSGDEQVQIISWFGEFKTISQIKELVLEVFKKTISTTTLKYYSVSPNWQPTIQKCREKYTSEMFKVELANERRRIEKLQDIAIRNYEKGNDKIAIEALREIHAQLKKGEPFIQNNYQMNVYKEMSDEEFDKRELELLQKRKALKEELNGDVIGTLKDHG